MKKVLVICQYYYPEPVRINDICEELVKKGYEVDVITDVPNYPMGEIYSGYENGKNRDETINGVNVHRCYTTPRKKGVFFRILNYYSFAISSTLYARKLKKEYDVVFVNQLSPVMMTYAGVTYKKKHNKRLVLYCLDLWPESLKVGGIKEKSIIYKIFKKISKRIYTKCDKIFITSRSFEKYLNNNFGIDGEKIEYLPQYAESLFNPRDCKKKKDHKLDLMFAGNLGKTQSLDTIIKAAEILKDNNIYWHFVGDGTEYERIKSEVNEKKLNKIVFYGRKPLDEMPYYYSKADAMLVTLDGKSAVSYTLPGKVQSYMAAGKPIIGAINGDTSLIIQEAKCGYCGPADNPEELAINVLKFAEDLEKEKMGDKAYDYYQKYFEKEKFLKSLEKELIK